jgi:hypothetical protein
MPLKKYKLSSNWVLNRLPEEELTLLHAHLREVTLRAKEEVNGFGSTVRYLYFPGSAGISLMDMQPSGDTVEVTVVGKEGCTCPHVLDGSETSLSRIVVQVGGTSFRLNVSALSPLLDKLPCFTFIVRRYSAVLFRHAVISVGCSQYHTVEQRIGRWLLAHHHRTGLTSFDFTHEFLADLLGVQRVTVTDALAGLEMKGMIATKYGKVDLQDMPQMARTACPCFDLAKQAIDDYMSDIKRYRKV